MEVSRVSCINVDAPASKRMFTASLRILCGIHLAVALVLISRAWVFSQIMLMIVVAIPLSQLSLVTLWAVVGCEKPLLRYLVPVLGIATSWFLLSRILPWGIGEPASAGWAVSLALQVFTIVAGIQCAQLLNTFCTSAEASREEKATNAISFGIGELLLWTTAIGLCFGFIRFGQYYWQWTTAVFHWELFGAMPIIGVVNGSVAGLWLWTFASTGVSRYCFRAAISVAVCSGLAVIEWYATEWATGTIVLGLEALLILLAAQSLVLSSSLAIFKLAGNHRT